MKEDKEKFECIDMMPKEVIIQSNSENKKKAIVGGVEVSADEYSISIPGPGEYAINTWKHAKEKGHEICAKVQVNVTWECSTVPYLPAFDLIRKHMTNLKKEGVGHMLLGWTLGGYPSINLKVATSCLDDPSEENYDALLKEEFGEMAPVVKKATALFSEAFREFPFSIYNVYNGPHNAGPSNLLYEKESGFDSTMTCYAFDALDIWRRQFPREIYRDQLRKLSEKWLEGLKVLDVMPDCEFKQVSIASYLLFYSSYMQTDFIMTRDSGDKERIQYILDEERKNAVTMYEIMRKNALIGYEAANHYYFNKGMLVEKVISCDYLKSKF